MIGGESADFRQLLKADYLYLNGRLAQFYGADLSPDAPFQKVQLEPHARAGVLVSPLLDGQLRLHGERARRSIAASLFPGACWAGCCGRRPRPLLRWRRISTPT